MSAGVSVSVPVPCTDEPIDVNAEHAAAQQEVGERSHKRLRSEDGNSSGDGHTSNGCIDAAEDQRNKRQHGHHGHLRTHHAVDDEPDEEGANVPALASSSGAPAGTSSRVPNAVASPKAAAEAEATPNTLHAGGAPKTASNAKVKHQVKTAPVASTLQSCYWVSTYVHCIMQPQAQLSFADELEEDEDGETPGSRSGLDSSSKSQDGVGGGGGGGGLRAATANRFKQEKRAARQQQLLHQPNLHVFRRSDTGGGDDAAEAGAGHAHAAVAVVDDDVVDGEGPSHRSSAPTLGRIHFGAAQARGMRHYMEDRHCVVSSMQLLSNASGGGAQAGTPLPPDGVPRSYAAIFDGHNGAGAAELAASRLHVLLAAHPALRMHTGELGPPAVAKSEEVAIGAALRSAFGQVDEATLAVARREGVRDGATALVVLRLGQVLYAAHAGDSRAVLCRDGSALRLTEDHKPHLPRERARIEDAGGRVDFQRCWRVVVEPRDGRPGSGLAVSRSLGDLDFKEPNKFVECEPDVLRVPMRPLQASGSGDAFVILGSDGLWDVLSDEDAVHCAKRALQAYRTETSQGGNPGDAEAKFVAEALLDESLRRGTADNVTVVFMLLSWA